MMRCLQSGHALSRAFWPSPGSHPSQLLYVSFPLHRALIFLGERKITSSTPMEHLLQKVEEHSTMSCSIQCWEQATTQPVSKRILSWMLWLFVPVDLQGLRALTKAEMLWIVAHHGRFQVWERSVWLNLQPAQERQNAGSCEKYMANLNNNRPRKRIDTAIYLERLCYWYSFIPENKSHSVIRWPRTRQASIIGRGVWSDLLVW